MTDDYYILDYADGRLYNLLPELQEVSPAILLWHDRPEAVYEIQEKQMIDMCVDFCQKHPDIGAVMLECTGMQPFARAIQQHIDLPVFSWGTILDYAFSVVTHRDYYGHV